MKKIKILISIVIIVALLLICQTKVEAKSYYIEEMDIKATVMKNGDVEIEQILTYSFNGSYNGIYITIPTQYENKEEVISQIDDDIYNVQNVELKSVSQILTTGTEIPYSRTSYSINGNKNVYLEEIRNDIYKLKVYCPSNNVKRTFKVNYILKNLCVKHNDVGELYYNFIGGEWECSIEKLKIDIFLPNNTKELRVWGHGPDNGQSKIIDNTHVNLEVNNIKKGEYVAARVIFDKSNIENEKKVSKLDAYNLIYEDEQKIAKISDAKKSYTRNMALFALALIVYWIVLLVKYEKDKKYKGVNPKEDEMFEKYNPMLAGCLEGNRCILARDIIAVILNLIDKGNIKLEIKSTLDKKENYRYFISKVQEKESTMDIVEKYVYDWVFGGSGVVNLADALERMPKDKEANKKFKELNNIVQKELNKKGANNQSVPKVLRIFNTILFIFVVFLVLHHIIYQGNEIDIDSFGIMLLMIIWYSFLLLPMLLLLLYIPILLIVLLRHGITRLIHKITGKKLVTTLVTIIIISVIILVLTIMFVPKEYKYIIVDELLICIAIIIMLTDNLMLKNSIKMIEDFSRINSLKEKIEDYTMMEDRDIEQVKLWGKYLAYAVSFGMAHKISKRIKQLNIDDDLLSMVSDVKIFDYISSDYYYFYNNASLDKRFMKKYTTISGNILSSYGRTSGSSSGRGGGFSGGGGFSRTEVAEAEAEALSKN